jgi:hypothetical protein
VTCLEIDFANLLELIKKDKHLFPKLGELTCDLCVSWKTYISEVLDTLNRWVSRRPTLKTVRLRHDFSILRVPAFERQKARLSACLQARGGDLLLTCTSTWNVDWEREETEVDFCGHLEVHEE